MHRRPHAFTLVELLVVISIIGMLMALLFPALGAAMAAVRKAQCAHNMEQIGKAMIAYNTRRGNLPGRVNLIKVNPSTLANVSEHWVSWVAVLLPDIEKNEQWDRIREIGVVPTTQLGNIEILICPSDIQTNVTEPAQSLVVNSGVWDVRSRFNNQRPSDYKENGVFHFAFAESNPAFFIYEPVDPLTLEYISSHDGTPTTIMLSENIQAGAPVQVSNSPTGRENNGWCLSISAARDSIVWVNNPYPSTGSPTQALINREKEEAMTDTAHYARPSSNHIGGVNVLYCDGHVDFLSEEIDYWVYQALMTPHGRKCKMPDSTVVPDEFYNYILKDSDY